MSLPRLRRQPSDALCIDCEVNCVTTDVGGGVAVRLDHKQKQLHWERV
jgi:hypothetical protein